MRRCCLSRMDAALLLACLRRRCPVRGLEVESNVITVLAVLMSPCSEF